MPAGEARTIGATLDDLARAGVRRMIAAALQLEAAEFVVRFRAVRATRTAHVLAFATAPRGRAPRPQGSAP